MAKTTTREYTTVREVAGPLMVVEGVQRKRRQPLATALVAAAADGDGIEPRLETGARVVKAGEVLEGIDEGVLKHVFRVLRVKHKAVTQAVYTRREQIVQRGIGGLIALQTVSNHGGGEFGSG